MQRLRLSISNNRRSLFNSLFGVYFTWSYCGIMKIWFYTSCHQNIMPRLFTLWDIRSICVLHIDIIYSEFTMSSSKIHPVKWVPCQFGVSYRYAPGVMCAICNQIWSPEFKWSVEWKVNGVNWLFIVLASSVVPSPTAEPFKSSCTPK